MKVRTRRAMTPRPPTSISTRLISKKLQGRVDLQGELLYGVHANVGIRETSPTPNENHYYTVKYVGITNGELGVLSQRKPLLSPKSQFRYLIPPGPLTPQPTTADMTNTALPAEFLRPNPSKYNEFIVHQYSRPRPLTASKRERGLASPVNQNWLIEGAKYGVSGLDTAPAKVERKAVSGWKLSWPRSHSSFACRTKQKPVALLAAKQDSQDSQNYIFGEAYLHYLQQAKA